MSGSESETEELKVATNASSVKSSDSSVNSTPKKLPSTPALSNVSQHTQHSQGNSPARSNASQHSNVTPPSRSKVSLRSQPSSPIRSKVSLHKEQSRSETKVLEQDEKIVQEQQVIFVHKNDVETRQEVILPMNTTVKSVKAELAKVLKLQKRNVRLVKDGRKMQNREIVTGQTMYKFKQEQQSTSVINQNAGTEEITIEIGLDDSDSESEDKPDEGGVLMDSAVNLESGISGPKMSIMSIKDTKKLTEVAVIRTLDSRQYLGGYRNKKTGVIYYHAASQTEYKKAKLFSFRTPAVQLYTRETQTLLPLIEEGVNTTSEKCTQMVQREVYIPAITDKIVTAREYQPYVEKNKLMTPEAAARILQKAWKFFIKKKRLHDSYRTKAEERAAKQQYKGSSLAEFHKLQLSLLTKDSFPSTRGDFYDLYTKLGEWKRQKVNKLKEEKSGFAYKVAVADLQKKELQGILAIEEQRIQARNENLNRQDITFLEGTARSRVRQYPKGNITIIDDLNIQRARNFKEQFASYTRTDVTKSERIEILSCMKSFLAEFEAVDVTGDLIELIDREIDMIMMEIDDKHLSILRKRFESLFINLAKNPEFNPQAKYFRSSSQNTKKYAKYKCISCGKVMYPSLMFMHLRMSRFRQCMSCAYMHTTATASTNLAPYKRILLSLRAVETEKCCRSAIPFLLQPMGMYFLVNVLWDGKSVLSGSSYLPGLKVTRWLPNQEWSMWNMILLTELEAHKHDSLPDPLTHYSSDFILNVMNRNILGRIHFNSVADIDAKFRERESIGVMPKDHLLFVRKKDEAFLSKNDPHPCLITNKTYLDDKVLMKKDTYN